MTRGFNNRTNAQWLAGLRQHAQGGVVAGELQNYLRRGLARALAARRVNATDLEDFAQDALVRILQGPDTFRRDSRFVTWAMAVALRTALSTLRRRYHGDRPLEELELGVLTPSESTPSTASDPAQIAERGDLLEALNRAIQSQLTIRQRTAVLGELSGVPVVVLAERLGISSNTFYKLHHDARKKLRRALNRAGFSDEDVREELMEATRGM